MIGGIENKEKIVDPKSTKLILSLNLNELNTPFKSQRLSDKIKDLILCCSQEMYFAVHQTHFKYNTNNSKVRREKDV